MSFLTRFLEWLLGTIKRGISLCVSVPGFIIVSFGSLATVVTNFLLDLPFFSGLINAFDTAIGLAESLLQSSWLSSNIAKTLIYTTNVQQLFLAGVATLTATFGAVAFISLSLLAVILPLILAVFAVRFVLKLISVGSGGILSP